MFDTHHRELLGEGRRLILQRQYASALRSFQKALADTSCDGEPGVTPQFLSHYGAALALASGKRDEGRRLCERSIQLEPYEHEHYLNLARIHLASGNRHLALASLEQGLLICSDHPMLLQERHTMERRAGRIFPGLSRDHLLNRGFGKLLYFLGLRPAS
jgi:Flp pilus assembly protein TadD